MRSVVTGKHPRNVDVELDKGGVHKRKRNNKPDYHREDSEAIFEVDGTRLVRDETGDKAFHRTRPP
jgi:hypothetical protein